MSAWVLCLGAAVVLLAVGLGALLLDLDGWANRRHGGGDELHDFNEEETRW